MVNEFHLTINHEKIIKFQLLNEIIIDKIIIKWSYIFLQKPKKEIALKHVQEASIVHYYSSVMWHVAIQIRNVSVVYYNCT